MNVEHDYLFSPLQLGHITLRNRIVMAPLTRSRASHVNDVPHALNAKYYAQRASAGLIISEATQISPTGKGYAWTPGIYSPEQVIGWRLITEAVHAQKCAIYAQLWHVGRISHPSLQPNHVAPVAPSAIAPIGQKTFIGNGQFAEIGTPRALELHEIQSIIEDYRKAARNAINAGFDGVEIHAANGYLIHQFLCDGSNQRTDCYGSSLSNRLRFAMEVIAAIVGEIGAHRTGIRISPMSPANGITDSTPWDTFSSFVREIDRLKLIYIHVIEGATGGSRNIGEFDFHALRKEFTGRWIVNNGYTKEMAIDAISSGYADLVSFGKDFIANPDLVERFKLNASLNTIDKATLYGGDAKGYTDYPTLR